MMWLFSALVQEMRFSDPKLYHTQLYFRYLRLFKERYDDIMHKVMSNTLLAQVYRAFECKMHSQYVAYYALFIMLSPISYCEPSFK